MIKKIKTKLKNLDFVDIYEIISYLSLVFWTVFPEETSDFFGVASPIILALSAILWIKIIVKYIKKLSRKKKEESQDKE